MFRFVAILLLVAAASGKLAAQTDRITAVHKHAWLTYAGNHPLSDKWGVHIEGQWRRSGLYEDPMQLLLRWGANYYLTSNVSFTAGYGYIRTYRYGSYPVTATFPEHRIWQQALMNQKLKPKVSLQHRYRLEQRYIGVMSTTPEAPPQRVSWRYENRFRYMLRADFALTQKENRPDWYIGTYNEVKVNFGKNVGANVFDQNRAYLALGKAVNRSWRVEAGYLNQLVQQRNGRIFECNHTLMVSILSSLRFRD